MAFIELVYAYSIFLLKWKSKKSLSSSAFFFANTQSVCETHAHTNHVQISNKILNYQKRIKKELRAHKKKIYGSVER